MNLSYRRWRLVKLIQPGLQLRLVLSFAGISVLSFVLQALMISTELAEAAARDPRLGTRLTEIIPGLLRESFLVSIGILLPLTLTVGVLVTFRVAGPIYRFKDFLNKTLAGEQVGPCKLRDGDELGDLCEVLNQVTEPLRRGRIPTAPAAQRRQPLSSAG